MINKQLRQATQKRDWQQVKQLEEILKIKAERRQIELNILKTRQEIEKMQYDIKFSVTNLFFGFLSIIAVFATFLKNFFNNK